LVLHYAEVYTTAIIVNRLSKVSSLFKKSYIFGAPL